MISFGSSLVYPIHLHEDKYKYRHIKLHIMKNVSKTGTATEMVKKAQETGESIIKAGAGLTTSLSANFGDSKSSLKAFDNSMMDLRKEMQKDVKSIGTIILPLPNEFTESIQHDFDTKTGVAGSISNMLSSGDFSVGNSIGMASDSLGMRKPLLDPGYWQNYTGTQPREFTFSFDFVPDSKEEATTILDIITKIKHFSLPETIATGVAILAPHFFKIELANPYISQMVRLDEVVLTNMNINYSADGQMQQIAADGMPKFINVQLSFRDKRMLYSVGQ